MADATVSAKSMCIYIMVEDLFFLSQIYLHRHSAPTHEDRLRVICKRQTGGRIIAGQVASICNLAWIACVWKET